MCRGLDQLIASPAGLVFPRHASMLSIVTRLIDDNCGGKKKIIISQDKQKTGKVPLTAPLRIFPQHYL
jgi:hypothetical protein